MRRPRAGTQHNDGMSPARPGADTRVWLTYAIIKELGYDPTCGVFADVQLQPTGEIETVLVGGPFAGEGFGLWFPLEVDDTVVVGMPLGDSAWGPVLLSRVWNSGDRPPLPTDLDWAPRAAQLEPPTDVWLRAKAGQAIKIRAQGADIDIRVEATGDIVIENLGTGKVKLGLADTAQPLINHTLFKTLLAPIIATLVAAPGVTDTVLRTAVVTALTSIMNAPIGTLKTEAT